MTLVPRVHIRESGDCGRFVPVGPENDLGEKLIQVSLETIRTLPHATVLMAVVSMCKVGRAEFEPVTNVIGSSPRA